MGRVLNITLQSLSLFLFLSFVSYAGEPAYLKEVPRKVLALYHLNPQFTPAHLYAEVVLNHLGLEVVHRSIDDPLPTDREMKGVRGVLTWFKTADAVGNPRLYCEWAKAQMDRGLKLVILGEPGIFAGASRVMPPACQEMFHTLGLNYSGNFSDNPFYFDTIQKDSEMVEFERKLLLVEGNIYSEFQAIDPQAKVYLKIKRRDMEGVSDMVVTTPHGGFAHASYIHYAVRELQKSQWHLNPFLFFEEAFELEGLPKPDTTTLNGRRIFYSHIDGDGIVNVSHIKKKTYSGEIILEEVLKKYSGLPVTASIITGYLDMREFQDEQVIDMYRNIFSLRNVEVASHGHAHPLVWASGRLALNVPGYDYSDKKEIVGSVARLKGLLVNFGIPKEVSLFLWTGDCVPNESQLGVASSAELLNMNGGDSRFDRRYDSYSFLHPLSIAHRSQRQIYSSAPNENIYTNLWKGPYYGYSEVVQSFKNTEDPIRIKPINIYYHYYSGEVAAALKAVQKAYDYVLDNEVFPMFASEYVRIVQDFFSTKIMELPGNGFEILNGGHLKTIRFDHEKRNVDLDHSRGVVGFRYQKGALYVFLDDRLSHEVYLTTAAPERPYVVHASFQISNFKGDPTRVRFNKQGWEKSVMELGGLIPDKEYGVYVGKSETWLKSDHEGHLQVNFERAELDGPPVSVLIAGRYY